MSEFVIGLHRCVSSGVFDFSILNALKLDKTLVQECEVLDFKRQLPNTDFEYAKTVRDLVALHNSYGGFLVFGVCEIEKDRSFEIVGVQNNSIQLNKLRDMARNYASVDLRLSFFSEMIDERKIEVVWVGKRGVGDGPTKFHKHGPEEKPGKPCFKRGDVVFRRLESNAVAQLAEDYDFLYSLRRPPSIELPTTEFMNEEPLEHNLPDRAFICSRFIGRYDGLGDLWTWLADDFSKVRLIAGEGGLGKTSLAYRFSEEVVARRIKPFEQVVWLTAKKRQFVASQDDYRENSRTDYNDAASLFVAIASAHGCLDSDFDGCTARELMQLALDSCAAVPSFVVVDDVDSLSPEDQQRALEFGMMIPSRTKMLLTTRVNFSYSPDNVLKLTGLPTSEFKEYIHVNRDRYGLPAIKDSKIDHLHEVTGGSPLFTDSLLRLERRGLQLDQAINQWKSEKGLEVRKAALQREIMQLGKEAKRVLYVLSLEKSASYIELSQVLRYADQTLGDAIQELAGLFLVSAPSIGKEARYTVDPNTALLVLELGQGLGIDHTALVDATKRARSDAIGLSLQKRSGIIGQAISQAVALLKSDRQKDALEAVLIATKKLSKPHPDLLLAVGRFSLKQNPPAWDQASKAFEEAYALGQRKRLLFDLWFESEYGRGSRDSALEVATKAINLEVGDVYRWYERRAQVHIALASKSSSKISVDSSIREVDSAIDDLKRAKNISSSNLQRSQMDQLIYQASKLRNQLVTSAQLR